jgi:hypothetical protein
MEIEEFADNGEAKICQEDFRFDAVITRLGSQHSKTGRAHATTLVIAHQRRKSADGANSAGDDVARFHDPCGATGGVGHVDHFRLRLAIPAQRANFYISKGRPLRLERGFESAFSQSSDIDQRAPPCAKSLDDPLILWAKIWTSWT